MIRFPRRFGSRINNKLILLSVLPVTLVTVIITLYTIDSRTREIRQFHLSYAERLAQNLATISDFALYSGDEKLLTSLAQSAREVPSISAIYFLNSNRESMLPLAEDSLLDREMLLSGQHLPLSSGFTVVEQAAYLSPTDVNDFGEEPSTEDPVLLGWVIVVANDTEAIAKAREILISHLLISFIVLLGAVLLSFMLSKNVVSPVKAMIRAVRELEKGNYGARIHPATSDELAILANGINHLAKAVGESRLNLENKVELATYRLKEALADLTKKNSELESARRAAEDASTAKGDFLAQMSHELRTPITAIQGFVRLLESSDLSPAEDRYCAIIQQASEQLLQLIDDILDITRLQSNTIQIEALPFNLVDCVEAPLALMAAAAHNKQLELIFDLAPNVPLALVGDSLRIRQIIYNLVSNAIKFTPAGHVMVKVRTSAPKDGRATLLFQILDTGIGIPDRQQARLFEPFSQADTSISRRFGGSGLGLSIVKQLVNLMQGTISLESTTGRGSIFVIRIPVTLQASEPETSILRKHVMLFDSHPQSRQALENHLSRHVETIESCEDFSDLDFTEASDCPEMVIYSPRVTQRVDEVASDLHHLREHIDCPIAVLIPTTSHFKNLPEHLGKTFENLSFHSKPPGTRELATILASEDQSTPVSEHSFEAFKANILVAEDNEFTRLLLETFFSQRGCNITLAENGDEAIERSREAHFDLILMDVHMPEVNGISALETIRGLEGPNIQTPIIMLTADILQQEENALFEMGASDLVFKPFDEHRLMSAVEKHLRKSISDQAPAVFEADDGHQRRMFVDEVVRLTELAKTNLQVGDGEELRETIHQLLGIAGVYHMDYLERAVQSLHTATKTGNGNKIVAAMETLSYEVEKLAGK